jgi:hypothetical protein
LGNSGGSVAAGRPPSSDADGKTCRGSAARHLESTACQEPRYCTVIVPTIPGWIVQWYVNVPAVLIVTGELVAPPLMVPVPKRAASCVASCAIVSLFFHATVCPTRIVVGLGEYDWLARSPTIEIVTSAEAVGAVGLELLPQAEPATASSAASAIVE